ncbi:protein phosphatase regulator [Dispira parvispora]|uniref:Protein phosphatase regulator n=1 Tax=Dispira parvispora TaxID=1520584 RepID=A0A9W8AP87_9FUNG|nr:protein phosphatase regulator [Dispira parvispora]
MLSEPPTSPTVDHLLLADNGHSHPNIRHCVDYLSYIWDLEDLAESWKVVTREKYTLMNGIRLENASWRVWAKTRNSLRTVRPESLNWCKDNDATWLYGPLYSLEPNPIITGQSPLLSLPNSPTGLKSVLKRRPASDVFRRRRGSPVELVSSHPFDYSKAYLVGQAGLGSSDTASYDSVNTLCQSNNDSTLTLGILPKPRLRFKSTVEQCIALSPDVFLSSSDEEFQFDDEDSGYFSIGDTRYSQQMSQKSGNRKIGNDPFSTTTPTPSFSTETNSKESKSIPPLDLTTVVESGHPNPSSLHNRRRRHSHCTTIVRLEPTTLKPDLSVAETTAASGLLNLSWFNYTTWSDHHPPSAHPASRSLPYDELPAREVVSSSSLTKAIFSMWLPSLSWFTEPTPPVDVSSSPHHEAHTDPVDTAGRANYDTVGRYSGQQFPPSLPSSKSRQPRPTSMLNLVSDDYSLSEHIEDVIMNARDIAVWCVSLVKSYNAF